MIRVLRPLSAFASGLIFGFGLALSGMMDPTKVIGFLDLFGQWDPSLAFVLFGAVSVSTIGYAIRRRMNRPLIATEFSIPTSQRIDRDLIVGATIFGIGWGLVGLCPGPAIAGLALGLVPTAIFCVSMITGMGMFAIWSARFRTSGSA